MTLDEYSTRLGNLTSTISGKLVKDAIVPSANELLASLKNRIVVDGKNSSGLDIGSYSTKSAYYNKERFDRKSSFKARGKENKGDFQNGKKRTSMYFSDGYKGLRNEQGKPSDKMVLNYTGSTMVAYQQNERDDEVVQGMTTEKAADIRQGHEDKRGAIYKASNKELEDYNNNVVKEMQRLNIEILTGVSE